MRSQPLINCHDVQASSRWYQRLLGCVGGHGGTEYDAPVLLDVHRNPNAHHRELWVRDPNGYTVVIASPDGEAEDTA